MKKKEFIQRTGLYLPSQIQKMEQIVINSDDEITINDILRLAIDLLPENTKITLEKRHIYIEINE